MEQVVAQLSSKEQALVVRDSAQVAPLSWSSQAALRLAVVGLVVLNSHLGLQVQGVAHVRLAVCSSFHTNLRALWELTVQKEPRVQVLQMVQTVQTTRLNSLAPTEPLQVGASVAPMQAHRLELLVARSASWALSVLLLCWSCFARLLLA